MKLEITEEEYNKYVLKRGKKVENNENFKHKFNIGQYVNIIDNEELIDKIFIIDWIYPYIEKVNIESINNKDVNNKIVKINNIYYIIHDKEDINIKYTVLEKNLKLYNNPIIETNINNSKDSLSDKISIIMQNSCKKKNS